MAYEIPVSDSKLVLEDNKFVTLAAETVTAQVAVLLPSCVVKVIVAEPTATPVTTPVVLTVANAVLLDVHVTFLLVAFEGATVAVNEVVAPATTLAVVGATVTPVTATAVPEAPQNSSSAMFP